MFKKNFNKGIVLWLSLIMAFMLCGCGAGNAEQDNDKKTTVESTEGHTIYESRDIRVAALKGPTGMGLVKLMKDNDDQQSANHYDFTIAASADEFTAKLIKGDVQIAAIPCNAAAALYNKSGGKIKVLGVNTLGVLYVVSTGDSVKSVADLKGKVIYTTGMGTTPEYTLKYLLKANGIDPDKDVTIEFKSEATQIAAMMEQSDEEMIAMLPQPFVTTVLANNKDAKIVIDVEEEWEKSAKAGNITTGVVVVNTAYYNSNKAAVDKFMEEYAASVKYVNENVEEAAELVEKYGIVKAAVAKQAIPKCNITLLTGSDAKAKISSYLKVLYDANPDSVGGKMPEDGFYAE